MRPMFAFAAALALSPGLAKAADACAELRRLRLDKAEVTSAQPLAQFPPAEEVDPKGPAPVTTPFCRVAVSAKPTPDSDIRIELWIPAGPAWNGRFLQVGNGGFAGRVPYRSMMAGLAKGYAVAGTDDGHEARKDDDSTDASWAPGHPEKVVDFGYRAVKTTTDVSKAILTAYGDAPKFSYFNGCSDGGREALMEAQRYPQDFDGIVAGDPANDWTRLQAAGLLSQKELLRSKAAFVPISKLPALQAAARKACADEVGVIENPAVCRFDPRAILCAGPETDACLTRAQERTVARFYAGARDRRGALIMPGLDPGAEAEKNGWGRWVIGEAESGGEPSLAYKFNVNFFSDVVHDGKGFKLRDFDFDRDFPSVQRRFAPILNATDPDLGPFKARGGKLIQYHGWADPAIPAKDSILYFEAVQKRMGDTGDFYRLFLAPGMLHCTGGPGPSGFDAQGAISAWVEKGQAPKALIAAKFVDDNPALGVAFARPLCPYPAVAKWDGTGPRAKPESWTCARR